MKTDYEGLLKALEDQQKAVLTAQAKERGNLKFKCVCCDGMHTISKCDAFTFPTWESGSGYDDGRWWEGEIYIQCPVSLKYNRCYFPSPPYPHYGEYAWDADMQFKKLYRGLFKSLTQGDDNKKLGYSNNMYFSNNHKKFGIEVKGGKT